MRAGDLPLSAWWGVAALTKRDVLELQLISAGSVAGLVVGPWLLYHGRRVDPLYKYPCSLSHTIRGPDVVVRGTYAASYAAYLVALRALAARRCSPGMRTTWWLCAVGALHAVVSIPDEADAKRRPRLGAARTVVHYGSALSCVLGLGYGFAQPRSTHAALKAHYLASALALALALGVCNASSAGGGEDAGGPYWSRVLFMASEYSVFLAGAVAIGRPLVAP